jgi:mono/diheme cytochrome c family protein
MNPSPKIQALAVATMIVALTACEKDKAPSTSSSPSPLTGEGSKPPAPSEPKDAKKLAAQGEKLYTTLGCNACHSADGSMRVGPTLSGIYGSTVELTDGQKVRVDDAYIRTSILDPSSQVVKGYVPTMTPYKGRVDEPELEALTEWIKSLK